MSEPLIKITGLKKSFPTGKSTLDVLSGVDLSVERGEFVAIEGRSGCGKSTLLSIIGLLDNPGSGSYLLCDQDVMSLSAYQHSVLRNRHIGWVFQNFNLFEDMTVAENVMMPLRYDNRVKKGQYHELANQVLGQVELADKFSQYPGQLSGGQQQRVAIARALITKPDLILADEPTGNLDSTGAAMVFDLLKQLNRNGSTIIMVTHSSGLARQCQRRCYMKDGLFVNHENESESLKTPA